MATKIRLIGADGLVNTATISGVAITGSGTLASGIWYRLKVPGNGTFSTLKAGAILYGADAGTAYSGSTTSIEQLIFNADSYLDISSWTCEFTADEVDVTVLNDGVKKYRRGKTDSSGSLKGIVMLGTTTVTGGILNRFLGMTKITAVGANTYANPATADIFFKGIMQKDTASGESYAFIFGQIDLFSFSVGGESGGAQEFDAKFRFINDDPAYVEKVN